MPIGVGEELLGYLPSKFVPCFLIFSKRAVYLGCPFVLKI